MRALLPLHTLCAVCHTSGRELICVACVRRYSRQGSGTRQAAAAPLSELYAALPYAFPWDRLIADLKFREALDLTAALGERLATAWPESLLPDIVVPVPLAPQRLRERGFNQSLLLARAATQHLGWRRAMVVPNALLRTRDTPPQRTLSAIERARNVRDAFAVSPDWHQRLQDLTVALVDDVTTSGATLAEAARTLKAAGANRVVGWALAHA